MPPGWCKYRLLYLIAACIYTTKSYTPVVVYIFGVPIILTNEGKTKTGPQGPAGVQRHPPPGGRPQSRGRTAPKPKGPKGPTERGAKAPRTDAGEQGPKPMPPRACPAEKRGPV